MTWRRVLVAATVFLAFVLLVGLGGLGCDPAAEDVWRSMQTELADDAVISVQLHSWGPKQETLVGDTAEVFAQAFLAGTFDMDNPEHFGPTADITLLFLYEGREPVRVNQWPDDRFEVGYGKAQFLICSPELTQLLRSRGFVHAE